MVTKALLRRVLHVGRFNSVQCQLHIRGVQEVWVKIQPKSTNIFAPYFDYFIITITDRTVILLYKELGTNYQYFVM